MRAWNRARLGTALGGDIFILTKIHTPFSESVRNQEILEKWGETNLSSGIQQQETHCTCEKEPVLRVDVALQQEKPLVMRLKG